MPEDMDIGQIVLVVVLALLAIFIVTGMARSVRIVPQASALIVERLGRYSRTLSAGFHLLIPFIDRVRAGVDLREQVVSFPPQPVITSDNLVVSIDTVIYFQVTSPKDAVYEIANYITGIEQLTVTTLRNVIGSLDLEQTLTSRDQINRRLSGVLDETTGRWGIKVSRVEIKAIDPPASVQGSMEQQMRAERDRRATILQAEGVKQSKVLTAEGEKQAAVLRAEGDAQAAVLRAEGEARAILQVFDAVHRGDADPKLLAYQYVQALPKIAASPSNTMWFLPAELAGALGAIAEAFGPAGDGSSDGTGGGRRERRGTASPITDVLPPTTLPDVREALADARRDVEQASKAAAGASLLGNPLSSLPDVSAAAPSPVPPQAPAPSAPTYDTPPSTTYDAPSAASTGTQADPQP